MASPDRVENTKPVREASGVYSRSSDAESNAVDPDSLESLVKRASTRPPADADASGEFPMSVLERHDATPLESMLTTKRTAFRAIVPPPPAVPREVAVAELPTRVKWMIAVPWMLLACVVCAFAIAWPTGTRRRVDVSADAYALAPIPAGNTNAGATAPVDVAPREDVVVVEETAVDEVFSLDEVAAAPAPVASTTVVDPALVAPTDAPVEAAIVDAALVAEVPVADVPAAAPLAATAELLAPPTDPAVLATAASIRAHLDPSSAAPAATTSATTTEAALPAHPSRADVSRALRAVQGAVDACTAQTGVATLRLTVSNDGAVSSASALGDFAGTAEGACMAEAVRGAHFTRFTEPSLTVSYPFVLR